MTLISGMTGFGRTAGAFEQGSWTWEAKSVNGRGLDTRVNVPSGFDALQARAKAAAGQRFKRGSLQMALRIEMTADDASLSVNRDVLGQLIAAYTEVQDGKAPSGEALATLMTARGVVQESQASLRDLAGDRGLMAELENGLVSALDKLKMARDREGETLHAVLTGLLSQMQDTVESCATAAKVQPANLKTRFEQQLADLGADKTVDADRLAAEVALAAAKADVREELDRLNAHIDSGRADLACGSPVGRKLDFLSQELNREANTLCSKATSLDLTNAGLTLKGLVDQFKEQAANVE